MGFAVAVLVINGRPPDKAHSFETVVPAQAGTSARMMGLRTQGCLFGRVSRCRAWVLDSSLRRNDGVFGLAGAFAVLRAYWVRLASGKRPCWRPSMPAGPVPVRRPTWGCLWGDARRLELPVRILLLLRTRPVSGWNLCYFGFERLLYPIPKRAGPAAARSQPSCGPAVRGCGPTLGMTLLTAIIRLPSRPCCSQCWGGWWIGWGG